MAIKKVTRPMFVFVSMVALGVIFQVGHFVEHAVQFGVWLSGQHQKAYMSPVAMTLVHYIGDTLFPTATMPRQMAMGMEVLHLIGNTIFLVTIGGLCYLIPGKQVRMALYIEAFHLVEHLLLTYTTVYLAKSIGMSTLFGYATTLGGLEFAVGYRVSWHFVLNLIPSALIMYALMKSRSSSNVETLAPEAAVTAST